MAGNNIDIKKVTGDVDKLNKELKETTNILGQLIAKQQTLNKEISSSKGLKDVSEKLNKSKKTANDIEKEAEKLIKSTNSLKTKQSEKVRALTKENIKQKEAVSKLNKELKAEDDAYKKLNLQYQKAQANAKKLAAQYGVSSKQAKEASKQAKILSNNLKKIDASVGQNQRSVGSYGKSLLNFAGQLGLVTGGAALLKKAFDVTKASILSIQTTGDKFTNSLAGMKEGFNSFIRGLATGTSFKDLIQNFRDATKAGAEYSAILDDLGDLQRSLRIAESETRLEQEKLLTISRDVSKTDLERIDAIDRYITIEKELTAERKKNAEQAYAAEVLIATKRSDLTQSEIEAFLENQEKYIDAVSKRALVDADFEKRRDAINTNTIEGQEQMADLMGEMFKAALETDKSLEKVIENAAQLDDAIRDRLVNAYTELINVETNSLKMSQRVLTMRGSLIKRLNDEKKSAEDLTKANKDYLKSVADIIKKRSDGDKAVSAEAGSILDKLVAQREAANLEEVDSEIAKSDAIIALEKLTADEKEAIWNEASAASQDIGNVLFDIGQAQRDSELMNLEENYGKRIEAAEGDVELQEKLQARLETERKKIAHEQAISERNQALFNIAINTAQAVAKVWGQTGLAGVIAQAAPIAMGLLQTGLVLSQPIPGFFKGTESAPAGLAWIAEKGAEMLTMPSGESMLIDKPQIMNLEKGTAIKTADQTQQLLNKAIYNDIAINGNEGIENRLDKLYGAIKGQSKEVTSFDDNGIKRYLQSGNSITRYQNKRGRK